MKCPYCEQDIPEQSVACYRCGAALTAAPNPFAGPMRDNQPPPQQNAHHQGDATGGIIPYKNPKALIAYYLGIVSGLPLIGLPFGIAAFVLGILGLRDRKKNPVIKGSAHAWIGIGCGGIFTIFWTIALFAVIATVLYG